MTLLSFTLNGDPVTANAEADALLVDVIRGLGFTGTKEGCGVGVCGACTVLVDDLPISSCIYPAHCVAQRAVWTAEGLARREPRLLECFVDCEALQCGICTPGQVVAAYACAREYPDADEDQIREFMAGNLCRCTGYHSIVEAVASYARTR